MALFCLTYIITSYVIYHNVISYNILYIIYFTKILQQVVIWHKHVIGRHTGPGEVGGGGGGDDEGALGIGDIDDEVGIGDIANGEGDDDDDDIDDGCVDINLEPGDLHPRHLCQQEPHSVQGKIKNYEDNDDNKDKDKDNCYTFAVF